MEEQRNHPEYWNKYVGWTGGEFEVPWEPSVMPGVGGGSFAAVYPENEPNLQALAASILYTRDICLFLFTHLRFSVLIFSVISTGYSTPIYADKAY